MIRLTKEFTFESAHALWGYDGKCREIHGHSYRLFVTVKGEPVTDPTSPKLGMVMDFGELKAIVAQQITDHLDHSFVMRRTAEAEKLVESMQSQFANVILVDYQPTCENMLQDFAARLQKALPAGVTLHSLRLHETATSYAEWYAEEN
ncbi:MAG: 6-carboxytetrahydropterin synthase [Rikenellaceae bacterium]|nr:6-carboxytetrahydropterin synthase [Rikenellaceae bacterium]